MNPDEQQWAQDNVKDDNAVLKGLREIYRQNKEILDLLKNKQQPTMVVSQGHVCPLHNVEMEEKDGKFGKFYSHYQGKNPETGRGIYCNGR